MEDKIIMIFSFNGENKDIEVPNHITANELIMGLNNGYNLGINMSNPEESYLRAENPVALVKGEKTLEDLGLRNGTTIFFER